MLIPKIMRELAQKEKCAPEVESFTHCSQASGVGMVFHCREENTKLRSCLTFWYKNEEFKEHCKELYLQQRSEYRATGISKKKRKENSINTETS